VDITLILTTNYPGTEWVLRGDEYSGLGWLDSSPKPSLAELESLWVTTQVDAQTAIVEQVRQTEYQKTADPLFFKWQAGSGDKQDWLNERERIKIANPYPPGVDTSGT